jgi:hypothetical protein
MNQVLFYPGQTFKLMDISWNMEVLSDGKMEQATDVYGAICTVVATNLINLPACVEAVRNDTIIRVKGSNRLIFTKWYHLAAVATCPHCGSIKE